MSQHGTTRAIYLFHNTEQPEKWTSTARTLQTNVKKHAPRTSNKATQCSNLLQTQHILAN